jgi:hypothetical protein
MAIAPQFERQRMISDAVALATIKIGKPGQVRVVGDRVFVRSGLKMLVLRAVHSDSVGPDGVALLGGSSWSFEESETHVGLGTLRWFASLLLQRFWNWASFFSGRTSG